MALIYLYGLFCLIVFLVRVIRRRYWANISDWMVWAGRDRALFGGIIRPGAFHPLGVDLLTE